MRIGKRTYPAHPAPAGRVEQKAVCYRLVDVLTAAQMDMVKPYMRTTFTEMWAQLCVYENDAVKVRWMLRDAAGTGYPLEYNTPTEGRRIEEQLYARAKAMKVEPVLGPPRAGED